MIMKHISIYADKLYLVVRDKTPKTTATMGIINLIIVKEPLPFSYLKANNYLIVF